MSDTLADLSSLLPSDFLSGDMNHHHPHRLPYDFASSSSTESESDDDDVIPGFTRHFTRSVSLQERLKNPYPVEKKRVFSGSPESTLNWNACGPTHVRSSPTTPFGQTDEDAWDLLYAAAGHVARMKMNNLNNNPSVFNNRGLLGAPRPLGPPLSHHTQNRTVLSEKELFLRQQLVRERVSGAGNYPISGRFVSGRPVGFGQSAWPPYSVETQRRQQPVNEFGLKPVPVGSNGVCGRAVKKGCAGTGVFLPRNYNNGTPDSMKKPVCSPGYPPARVVAHHSNKTLDHNNNNVMFTRPHQVPQVPPLPQPHHHNILKCDQLAELIRAHRQNAVMLAAQQRRNSSSPEERIGQTEVVLPQEWTY